MAQWMARAGKHGQWEQKFLDDGRIYLTWGGLNRNLAECPDLQQMRELLQEVYPEATPGKIMQNGNQLWAFTKKMKPGDWVALPSKLGPSIHIGEITGDYQFDAAAPDPVYHSRTVRWIEQDIPRTNFDQDILYSLGAFSTICGVKRNDAEARIRAMEKNGWKAAPLPIVKPTVTGGGEEPDDGTDGDEPEADLEVVARDLIAKHINAKFKGHGLARLVKALLAAQGYTVHQPPEGPDKGVDILAAPGELGFGAPKICVQVKSQDSPLDRPTLDQLLGTMSNVNADRGLLVCWGGFKSSVKREEATQFFRVRLWDQNDLIDQIFALYDRLDENLRTELPLKRVWTLAVPEESD